MKTKFEQAVLKKFKKGHKEHKQPWDLEHIDVDNEIKQECEDIYNYASLKKDDPFYQEMMATVKYWWKRIDIQNKK